MTRRYSLRQLVLTALLFAIGFGILGYWLGLRHGADLGVTALTAPRAKTALAELRVIRDGKCDKLAFTKEEEIDEAFYANYYLEDDRAFRLFPPPWGHLVEAARRDSLIALANYRREHPSRPFDALPPTADPSQWVVEYQQTVAEMVNRYATKQ